MNVATAAVNGALGLAYLGVGAMVLIDMRRGWKRFGFSHFGAALVGLAFTCGPHHLAHGIHVAFEGRQGGTLDVLTVAAGLPVAAIWLALRIEAFRGGRGDRLISGTPAWLAATPTLSGIYLAAVVAAALQQTTGRLSLTQVVIPNLALIVIYLTIGWFLLRTQLHNHLSLRGWSVSGLTFTAIFPTCAVMHSVWALYSASGLYEFDIHGFTINWLGIPAGLYFLGVTRALYRDSLRDWNVARAERRTVVTVR